MTRYRADPPETRRVVWAEGLSLIFHRPSGITHVVAPPVPEILAALEAEPADAAGIVAWLAAAQGLTADADAEAVVAARLAELEAVGLIARA